MRESQKASHQHNWTHINDGAHSSGWNYPARRAGTQHLHVFTAIVYKAEMEVLGVLKKKEKKTMPSEDKLHKVTGHRLMQLRWICNKVCSTGGNDGVQNKLLVLQSGEPPEQQRQPVSCFFCSCSLFIWYSVGPLIAVTLCNPDALQSKRES